MNTYSDKTSEKKSQAVAKSLPKQQSNSEVTFQFFDNRTEAIAQRKLLEMANNSSQVSQLKAFQEMANNNIEINHPKTIQRTKGKKDSVYNVQQDEILRIEPDEFLRNDFVSNHVSKKTDAMSKARERNLDMSTTFEMKPSEFGKEIREKNLRKNNLKTQKTYFSENSYPFISIRRSPDGSFNIHAAGSARLNYMVEPFYTLSNDRYWILFQAHHLAGISPTAIEEEIEYDDEVGSESDLEIDSKEEFDDF